jgi:hypothetical protein
MLKDLQERRLAGEDHRGPGNFRLPSQGGAPTPLGVVHEDRGLSGKLGMEKRPGLLAAVADLRRGDVLLVAKRDRLGRDPIVVAMVERLVTRKGALGLREQLRRLVLVQLESLHGTRRPVPKGCGHADGLRGSSLVG